AHGPRRSRSGHDLACSTSSPTTTSSRTAARSPRLARLGAVVTRNRRLSAGRRSARVLGTTGWTDGCTDGTVRLLVVPRPRFFRLPEDKRLALLRVAAEEFAREGFFGASYNRVIEQSPLGKSSAYLAFADKEDLFFTVLRHRPPPLHGPVPETLNDAAGFWPAVCDWIRRFGEHALEDPLVLPLAVSFYALLPNSARGQALEGDV